MLCINYCAPDMSKEILDEVPQIRISFNPNDETLEEFLERHLNQYIYIDITKKADFFSDKEILNRFKELKEKYSNWTLQMPVSMITIPEEMKQKIR